ncbi:MAG: transcription-repair coupling factor, partial [Alphaproteobacteria bacterium]|nr:transcription-repair coupling factor [Alphaproteobacteria bacterium]
MTQFKQIISGVPEGFIPFALAEIIKTEPRILFVAHTDNELQTVTHLFSIIAPHVRILSFPAWNTIPYDRSSPNRELESIRVKTLNVLAQNSISSDPTLVITTAPALMQKVPPVSFFKGKNLSLKVGDEVTQEEIQTFLTNCSFIKTEQVMEQGEYAVRGGILDIFPSGNKQPIRIDFFGDEVDSLSYFDVVTQKTIKKAHEIILSPTTEYTLSQESISLFRSEYRSLFGDVSSDPLYESVSSGIKAIGIEHWLPLFFEKMSFFTDYLKDFKIFYSPSVPKGIKDFSEQIQTYYQARLEALENKTETIVSYRPIPPELFFASPEETDELLAHFEATELSPFVIPNTPDMGGRISQSFAGLPAGKDVFNALAEYIDGSKEKIVIAVFSKSSLERIFNLLKERHILLHIAQNLNDALSKTPSILILEAEKGFKSPSFTLFSETDILGERLNKPSRYKKNKENFIEDISTLTEGDLVVHIAHGIGRYLGLKTITVDGISHDCLLIVYEGGDKLFVPVENLDMLSRYGSEDSGVSLDRLGSGAWEAKKEKTKKYLLEMAEGLIQIAAQRYACSVPAIFPPTGLYDEFCARFGYVETEDQLSSIQSVNADFAKGHPMERLVCGDVGFGKTEVALRAAFVAAMNGLQVAVV